MYVCFLIFHFIVLYEHAGNIRRRPALFSAKWEMHSAIIRGPEEELDPDSRIQNR
jgi:hypothetical protein